MRNWRLFILLALSLALIAGTAMIACGGDDDDDNDTGSADDDTDDDADDDSGDDDDDADDDDVDDDEGDDDEEHHWGYEDDENGPDHWGEEYPDCNGTSQSPVDLITTTPADLDNIVFDYNTSDGVTVVNNGHTIQVKVEPGTSKITVNGKDYVLDQIHWHAQSEHTANGLHWDMELHLVHKYSDTDLAVIGVLLSDGDDNPVYDDLWDTIPEEDGETTVPGMFDPSALLPPERTFFTYSGSLTTPPCSEIVTWLVMDHSSTLSVSQMAIFKSHYSHNFRPAQDLNGRTVQQDNTP